MRYVWWMVDVARRVTQVLDSDASNSFPTTDEGFITLVGSSTCEAPPGYRIIMDYPDYPMVRCQKHSSNFPSLILIAPPCDWSLFGHYIYESHPFGWSKKQPTMAPMACINDGEFWEYQVRFFSPDLLSFIHVSVDHDVGSKAALSHI